MKEQQQKPFLTIPIFLLQFQLPITFDIKVFTLHGLQEKDTNKKVILTSLWFVMHRFKCMFTSPVHVLVSDVKIQWSYPQFAGLLAVLEAPPMKSTQDDTTDCRYFNSTSRKLGTMNVENEYTIYLHSQFNTEIGHQPDAQYIVIRHKQKSVSFYKQPALYTFIACIYVFSNPFCKLTSFSPCLHASKYTNLLYGCWSYR